MDGMPQETERLAKHGCEQEAKIDPLVAAIYNTVSELQPSPLGGEKTRKDLNWEQELYLNLQIGHMF